MAEWTEPERFADWFGGAGRARCRSSTVSMDVRPGGSWRATMFAGPERREIRWKGEYREVVEPERLVFTITDQPEDDAYELVTVVLTDLGDGRTEMRFEQRGAHAARAVRARRAGLVGLLRPHRRAAGGLTPRRTHGRVPARPSVDCPSGCPSSGRVARVIVASTCCW